MRVLHSFAGRETMFRTTVLPLRSKIQSEGNGRWTDPDFPPVAQSVGHTNMLNLEDLPHCCCNAQLSTSPGASAFSTGSGMPPGWQRASQIFANASVCGAHGFRGETIRQGALGDCWLLSAAAVVAQREDLMRKIFVTAEPHECSDGVYCLSLFQEGHWRSVLIDEWLPVDKFGRLLFAHSTESGQLWPALLEKAFAKCYGSYSALEGGWVHDALVDLTGGVAETIDLHTELDGSLQAGLWKRLREIHDSGHLLGAGSPAGDEGSVLHHESDEHGIISGHAYAVLQLREVDDLRLLLLLNPWGGAPITGDFSRPGVWTPRLQGLLGDWRDDMRGTFWMRYETFVAQFDDIYICRIFSAGTNHCSDERPAF